MSLQQPESENLAFPESPKLVALAGDWHGNGSFARAAIESLPRDVDVLVHLGDFGYRFEPAFMEAVNSAAAEAELIIMFVRGNHDDTAGAGTARRGWLWAERCRSTTRTVTPVCPGGPTRR